MKWKIIEKTQLKKCSDGTYKDWKEVLAIESDRRCVYCAIRDNRLGGLRIFHVEHHKPKSLFKDLINDYFNLYYACPICNCFKGNSWFEAEEADWSIKHYPSPSQYNYTEFFDVDFLSFKISGKHIAGKFLVERLHLNRRHLIRERRREHTKDDLKELNNRLEDLIESLAKHGLIDLLKELTKSINRVTSLQNEEEDIALYSPEELR